jgi:type IV pilus assembly protein PilE
LKKHPGLPGRQTAAGFTLIEVMIVVAIIGILAAVALPSYLDYLRRGKLVDATNTLAAVRAKMEQYYQDNRSYDGSSSPCVAIDGVGEFSFKCEYDESKYKITASGSKSVADFKYTIDQDGTMATTSLPATWGSTPKECWVIRPGGTC